MLTIEIDGSRVETPEGAMTARRSVLSLGISDGDSIRLTGRRNSMIISARISDRVARNQLFVPFHFREAAANLLTSPVLEPHAKMAALKVVAVRVEAV
jgi:predicted molibdopterin-dependent oxidoreductase YjgC